MPTPMVRIDVVRCGVSADEAFCRKLRHSDDSLARFDAARRKSPTHEAARSPGHVGPKGYRRPVP